MVDIMSPERRSALMARVGPRDTAPERVLRRLLHSRGWRYRLHRKGLAGTPDLVFPGRRVAVFVHGCFWHGHGCRLGRQPKSRPEYWGPKIDANRERDARKVRQLVEAGWRVMTVWQCSLKDQACVIQEVESFLQSECDIAQTTSNRA